MGFKGMKVQIYLALGLVYHVPQLGAEIPAYYVCKRSAVKLFSNTTLNPEESSVSLFRDNSLINQWSAKISDDDDRIKEEKSKKRIVRDGNNDIWLHDFEESDIGLYKVLYSWEVNSQTSREKKMDATLNFCKPPNLDCKPHIQRILKHGYIISLNATLKDKGCGIPPVTAYWLGTDSTNSILEINSTKGPSSYFACIRGPAMRCLKDDTSHTDFCTTEIINTSESLDTDKPKSYEADKVDIIYCIVVYLAVVASIGLLWMLCQLLYFIHRRLKDRRSQDSQSTLNENSSEQCESLLIQPPTKDYYQQGNQSTLNDNSSEKSEGSLIQPTNKTFGDQGEQTIRKRVSS